MDDLVTWLRAQLDDDERVAREGTPFGTGRWLADGETIRDSEGGCVVHDDGEQDRGTAEHIARHDPARALAEVDAKRRILDLHTGEHDCPEWKTGVYADDWPIGVSHGKPGERWAHITVEHFEADEPCPTVRLLALPYADRPGYRDEWKP